MSGREFTAQETVLSSGCYCEHRADAIVSTLRPEEEAYDGPHHFFRRSIAFGKKLTIAHEKTHNSTHELVEHVQSLCTSTPLSVTSRHEIYHRRHTVARNFITVLSRFFVLYLSTPREHLVGTSYVIINVYAINDEYYKISSVITRDTSD